ncbi:hypothetical protein COY07_00605 [Candidatus Peregrinibacteria bacterium CG_4_10_14_0_2_um_filter_43_11]|nr:MAG: hypothetical protein COY07_00605 [Candidatus Peregrinibacteria bacterium CG_4_10_14_0_2_um_filter_43_11]
MHKIAKKIKLENQQPTSTKPTSPTQKPKSNQNTHKTSTRKVNTFTQKLKLHHISKFCHAFLRNKNTPV